MAGEAQNNAQQDVIGEEYASSLADLTVNSKPLINMLTMLAEENAESAPVIVRVIEKHLSQVKPEMKLPVLYLVDSIVKNIGVHYTSLFTQNIVSTFCSVFEKVEESTRASMFKLRQTWSDVFPPKKLYALDVRVKSIDPAWPITAPPPTSIHVNPAFLPKEERVGYKPLPTRKSKEPIKPTKPVAKPPAAVAAVPASDLCETEMRESLLKKQKELLELQQKKLELELLQTKARLHQQQIQLIQTVPSEKPPLIGDRLPMAVEEPVQKPAVISAPTVVFSEPEPMELALTPPDFNLEEIMQPEAVLQNRSPDKKKKDRDRDRLREPPGRKKPRKDSEEGRKKDIPPRPRKGKEFEPTKVDDEVVVVGSRLAPHQRGQQPTMREAAKAMPRIPKISQRHPEPALPLNRDPRLMMHKPAAERRKMEAAKKESAGEPKKRRTNRFDDSLFGNEDIDLRKVPAAPVVPPAPGVVIPPTSRDARRGGPRGRGAWPGRGRGNRGPREEEEREMDGSGSPRNMDFILEQAKENHRNGVINDAEYSTIIRQVFHMSETKMIREAQRRESFGPPAPGPHPDHEFPYRGRDGPPGPPFGPESDRMWNDPRRAGGNFPPFPPGPGRLPPHGRGFEMMPPSRPHHGPPAMAPANAFEVRPDEDMKTIPIDNVPREIRFYGDKAVILMAADDPRMLGFQPCVRRLLLDNLAVDCTVGNDYMDFMFDGQLHKVKIGAPTRELYIDGAWYECMFGGPPITVNLGGHSVQAALEGPPPTVKIGSERRLDYLAGRVTMIIDAHSVIPVYLDLKLQHFEMEGQIFALQFKDALRTVVIDGHPYRVDFGGLPMAIHLDGRKHFMRFSSLPRGVEPGRVLQPMSDEIVSRRHLEDEKPTASQTPLLGQLNISELLSKLVATGLLPGGVAPETAKPPVVKKEVKKEEQVRDVNLADSESMKIRPNAVVSLLYSGMQCGSCGLRFPADQTVRYSTHLDWHFRQNRREKGAAKRPQSRKWYCTVSDWIQFEETEGSEEKRVNWFEAQAKEKSEKDGDRNGEALSPEENTSVPVGSAPEENKCFVCHEELDQFFHEESEEWHLKDAVRMEGITFHRLCYRDHQVNVETGAYSPSDNPDGYGSASEEDKPASEEEKAAASGEEEKATASGEEEVTFETGKKVKMENEDSQLSGAEIPLFKPEGGDTDEEMPTVKQEEVDVVVKMEDVVPEEPQAVQMEDVVPEEPHAFQMEDVVPEEAEEQQLPIVKMEELEEPQPESLLETWSTTEVKIEAIDTAVLDFLTEAEPVPLPLIEDEAIDSVQMAVAESVTQEEISSPPEEEKSAEEVPEPILAVVQTPTVNTSLDGNVEMGNKQAAPAPSGFKIKINLFNKAAAVSPTPPAMQTETTAVKLESGSSEQLIIPPLDENALTNKPRLVGRKLTVLPLMTKGAETSGLCSIM